MSAEKVRAVCVQGQEAECLLLSDGSGLVLETNKEGRSGGVHWHRVEGELNGHRKGNGHRTRNGYGTRNGNGGDRNGHSGANSGELSVREAMRIAGPEFSGFVQVRSQVEAGWMLAQATWYREQSERLLAEAESLVADLPGA
jgi:hypothetical protein